MTAVLLGALPVAAQTPSQGSMDSLTATAGDAQVTLTWTYTAGTSGLNSWQYRRKTTGSYDVWKIIDSGQTGTPSYRARRSHTFTDVTNGTTYTYQMRGYAGSLTNVVTSSAVTPTGSTPPPPPPPPSSSPPPLSPLVITSSEGVTYSGNAQEGFSLSPLGEGGSIVYGGRTIDIPVTRDECQSPDNPAVIIPRSVLDRVREITFELSEASPQDSPPGFRVEGCTADIDPGVTLGQTETVTVCLPPSEVEGKSDIHRYDGEWGRLPSQLETVNDEELVCGETDTFSLFGVFLPVIESAEGVLHSEDAENGFSLTPVGVGGSIVYGEKTIDLSVTGDTASSDPAVIVPRNILDRVNGITFELSGVSPHDPPPGLRLSGFTAEVNLGVTLSEGETVAVCFPSAGGDIYRYSEVSGEWELLESREEMVNGEEVLCAETGAVSLTGVFVEETGGCAVAANGEGVRWQGAVLNLLLVMSVLLLAAKPGVYGRKTASG